jgi:hypothetical protein
VRVAESDVHTDGAAEVMDAADEPFDGAPVDAPARDLRHAWLRDAEIWRDDELASRPAERSRDRGGELEAKLINRIVVIDTHRAG